MEIQSKEITIVSPDKLIHHPKNMNQHSDEQIDRLIDLINYQGFRNPLVVQKGTNLVVAGNGRLMAARKMGLTEVPVTYQEFESEAQLYAYMVSDNAIAAWSKLDLEMIKYEAQNLDIDIQTLALQSLEVESLPDYSDKNKEIDTDNFGNDLQHTCPKCGFEFNE